MTQLRNSLCLLSVLLIAFIPLGCDSGGGNGGGGGLGDNVTLEVEGPSETTVAWSTSFSYNKDDGFCISSSASLGNSGSLPIETTLEPSSSGSCPPEGTDASNFTGVRVDVTVQSGSDDLTVRLLSNGNQVAETTDPSQTGTVTSFAVEAGDFPDLSDFPGN